MLVGSCMLFSLALQTPLTETLPPSTLVEPGNLSDNDYRAYRSQFGPHVSTTLYTTREVPFKQIIFSAKSLAHLSQVTKRHNMPSFGSTKNRSSTAKPLVAKWTLSTEGKLVLERNSTQEKQIGMSKLPNADGVNLEWRILDPRVISTPPTRLVLPTPCSAGNAGIRGVSIPRQLAPV